MDHGKELFFSAWQEEVHCCNKANKTMVIGPRVPATIMEERERHRSEVVAGSSEKSRVPGQEKGKIKQFFDPTKSVNEELKKEILSNIKSIGDRFE